MQRELCLPSCSTRTVLGARACRRPTTGLRIVCKSNFEHSSRVRGDVRRVYKYVSDVKHMQAWYPGVESVTRVRGEGVSVGNLYTVERKIMKMGLTSTAEVVNLEPGKKVVVSATSKWYDAVHELYFMSCRNDPTYTNVRYIMRIQLKSGAGAIQPLLAGVLAKIPEQGLENLRQLLNKVDTPLRYVVLDAADELVDDYKAASKSNWSWQSVWEGLGIGPAPTANSGSAFVDSLGYYAILGLDPKRRNYSDDEIKNAYRRAAMELHPDRAPAHDARAKESASVKFRHLQRAYGVLKNPEHKKMYDAGELLEELVR